MQASSIKKTGSKILVLNKLGTVYKQKKIISHI